MGKVDESKCLHCDDGKPNYYEKCFQNLITENTGLRLQIAKLQKEKEMLTWLNEVKKYE